MTTATTICQKAAKLVGGDRERQHGDKKENLGNCAALWAAYLGIPITAEQVAWMNVLQKCARTKTGEHNPDDYVDAAGWSGCAGEVHALKGRQSISTVLQQIGGGQSLKELIPNPSLPLENPISDTHLRALSEASVGD